MIREAIARLAESEGVHISGDEAERVALQIMDGEAAPSQIGAFLALLRVRGETADHLAGFVRAMRRRMVRLPRAEGAGPCLDTCGTGGDGAGAFNISTAAAFIAAAAGVRVAKHGNRSVSSQCGSADVLEALGIDIAPEPEVAARCLDEAGLCFLFAPKYHPAMRHAGPVRRELGVRTLFNLCGPLCNPALTEFQVVGVPSEEFIPFVAEALLNLGAKRALVLHGEGMDEIAPFGQTNAVEIRGGEMKPLLLRPSDLDLPEANPSDLAGGDALDNAALLEREVLANKPGPKTDVAALNAAAAIWTFGLADSLREGLDIARQVLAEGKPLEVLERLREMAPAPAKNDA